MNDEPLVSVIIPTYNRNETILRAVDSALNQTYENTEVIVVNDSPGNDLPDSLNNDGEVRIISHEENKGGAAARNTGIDVANGQLIAFLDDDDLFHREKISKQVKHMKSLETEYFGCFTHFNLYKNEKKFKKGEKEVVKDNTGDLYYRLLRGFNVRIGGCSSLLIKRKNLDEVEGFDERFPRHQDWELLIRLLKTGKISCVDKVLFSKIGFNQPDSKKLHRTKDLYLSKYQNEIDKLSDRKRKKVYRDNYSMLSENYFRNERNFRGFLTFLKAAKYTGNIKHISYSEWPPRIDNTK